MLSLAVAVAASAWLVGAQESDTNAFHPHAAVVFVRTGERTPTKMKGASVLTALGANQMYTLGQNFRTRYIAGNSPNELGIEHIANMSQDSLNNDQVLVQTLETPYLAGAATAFMQGLYPPQSISNGSKGDVTGILADGTVVDYPLNGYQYAAIQASGPDDPESVWVNGMYNCPIGKKESLQYFTTQDYLDTRAINEDFYGSLDPEWFQGDFDKGELDYYFGLEIADYLNYQYTHNSTVHRTLANDSTYSGVYEMIQALGNRIAWNRFGNTSTSDTDADNQAIAGKTLATLILSQFQYLVADRQGGGNPSDMSYPLNFVFGEYEPMISLISLMMADDRDPTFRSIPPYASALVFELFSTGANVDFPMDVQDLWVRFSFHNGTGFENKQLISFPIFRNGPSKTDMPWTEFSDKFSRIAEANIGDWCEMCSTGAMFCSGADPRNIQLLFGPKANKYKVSPPVAGVIGAIVTLVVAGLLVAAAMLLGGIRFHRTERKRGSTLGGFKGSAKLASDPDLSLTKNAAMPAGIVTTGMGADGTKRGHERVGSWELRQKEFGPGGAMERSPRGSFDNIDAVARQTPVEPTERV